MPGYWDVLEGAIDTFGTEAQLDMAQEEAAELIVAISHYERDIVTADEVVEEAADLQIMIDQLGRMLDADDEIQDVVNRKVDRLEKRIESPEKHFGDRE